MFNTFDDLVNKLQYSINNFQRLEIVFDELDDNVKEINIQV